MIVGFFVDLIVYLIAIFSVFQCLKRFLRVRMRRRTKAPQTRNSEEVSQAWIDEGTRSETTTSPTADVQGDEPRSQSAVPTGRAVNVASGGRIYRCEEVIKGDERYTQVCQVDRRGRQRSPASVSLGSLEEVAPRVL